MQTTVVAGFSEGLQTLFAGQIKMGFFILGAGGTFYGQLGMGIQATKIALGIKEQGVFRISTGTVLDYIMGSVLTSSDYYVKG